MAPIKKFAFNAQLEYSTHSCRTSEKNKQKLHFKFSTEFVANGFRTIQTISLTADSYSTGNHQSIIIQIAKHVPTIITALRAPSSSVSSYLNCVVRLIYYYCTCSSVIIFAKRPFTFRNSFDVYVQLILNVTRKLAL